MKAQKFALICNECGCGKFFITVMAHRLEAKYTCVDCNEKVE